MTSVPPSAKFFSGIPEHQPDLASLYKTVAALKDNVETLTQQNASARHAAAVTWNDLLGLRLISPNQLPTGSAPIPAALPLVYKEGTWTPVLVGATTAGTQTYSVQDGTYRVIGDLCHVTFRISLSAFDAATAGAVRISGLPFTARTIASGDEDALGVSAWGGITLGAGYTHLSLRIFSGLTIVSIIENGSGLARAVLLAAAFSNATEIMGSGAYRFVTS